MFVNQVAVFLENRKGRLNELSASLARAKVDVIAMTIADTMDFGIVRLVTADNDKAVDALTEDGFTVTRSNLLGVELSDVPGALAGVLDILTKNEINIEYLYSFARTIGNKAIILFKVAETDKAVTVLTAAGVKFIDNSIG